MSEQKGNISSLKVSSRLLGYAFRSWPGLIFLLVSMLLKASVEVAKPLPMLVLLDNVIGTQPVNATFAWILALLPGTGSRGGLLVWVVFSTILIFFLGWAFQLAVAYAKVGFGQSMVYDLAGDLYRHLHRLSIRYHSRHSIGDLIRRITKDTGSVSTIVNDVLLPLPVSIFTITSMIVVMWQLDNALTLISLAVIPLLAMTIWLYSGRMKVLSYRQSEAESVIYETVEQTLSAMPVVQAFSMEKYNDSRFAGGTGNALAITLQSNSVQLQFKVVVGLITALGTAAVILIGGSHVVAGTLTTGSVLVFIAYVAALYAPLDTLIYTAMTLNYAAGSAQRVVEVLDTEEGVKDAPTSMRISQIRGEIEMQDVTFGYERDRPVLHNISFHVSAGQTIAIVGPTGAGKSSLISLIPRFFDPWSGSIRIDGHDVKHLRLRELRDQISVVLQEPFLFPVSVAENIAYGCPGATQEQIEQAARTANAHDFIVKLSDGYETVLGERGASLSGGERQRISVARALLKDAPILIMDEPTSSIDPVAEAEILTAMKRLATGRTSIVIAHRLSTVREADQIIVLEEGRVVETGTHESLMAASAVYSRIATQGLTN